MRAICSRLTVLFLSFLCDLAAQEPPRSALAPCATPTGVLPWLQEYVRHTPAPSDRNNDTLFVGMQVHVVGKDDGTGYFPPSLLLDAFCRLNTDFQATGIRFFFKNDRHYIKNSAWRQHPDIPTGIEMMQASNVPDVLNAYLVGNPAGACGYNLPYAGIALANGCLFDDDHTWAHEAGHALSLPHPFIGWEGKTYQYGAPTPTLVTYDYTYFHEQPDTVVPAPPDTALVEYADESNCTVAADLFCDTPPDYLSQIWPCDANGYSLTKQKDPAGMDFYSDGSLFMSYAASQCQSRFSDDQIAAMRAFLPAKRASWLAPAAPAGPITGVPELLFPVGGQPAPSSGAVLSWQPVQEASHYLVQVSANDDFFPVLVEQVTASTTLALGQLTPGTSYYWRVRPFNALETCVAWTGAATFIATQSSSEQSPAPDGWRCYPTLLSPGQALVAELGSEWQRRPVECIILDARGNILWNTSLVNPVDRNILHLPSGDWSPGLYVMVIQSDTGAKAQTLTIMR